ncbi:MAG: type II toxin-antitoxin system RelE/ParE family toxin, partial [Patescibacteria group bacterium]
MTWMVIVFESRRGEKFVEEFIKSLEPPTIAKVAHTIDLLEKHGPLLGMPHSKYLTSKLHELRVRGRQEVRVMYTVDGNKIYLLHAFRKHTQKTPAKEIDIALRRMREVRWVICQYILCIFGKKIFCL